MPPETKPARPPEEAPAPPPPPPPRKRPAIRSLINAVAGIVLLGAVAGAAVVVTKLMDSGQEDRTGRKIPLGEIEVTYWVQKDEYLKIRVDPTLELDPSFSMTKVSETETRIGNRKAEIVDKARQEIRKMPRPDITSNEFDQRVRAMLIDLVNEQVLRGKYVVNVWIPKNPLIEKGAP